MEWGYKGKVWEIVVTNADNLDSSKEGEKHNKRMILSDLKELKALYTNGE